MIAKRQQGMTMWGMMFVLGVLGFFLFLFFKLLPPYLEDMKVRTALDGVSRETGVESMSYAEIVERLGRRLDIDGVMLDPQSVKVQPTGRGMKRIAMEYEVVVPLAFNVSALLEFKHAREVRSNE